MLQQVGKCHAVAPTYSNVYSVEFDGNGRHTGYWSSSWLNLLEEPRQREEMLAEMDLCGSNSEGGFQGGIHHQSCELFAELFK